MGKPTGRSVLALVAGVGLVVASVPGQAQAGPRLEIPFAGMVAQESTMGDGTYKLKFKVYNRGDATAEDVTIAWEAAGSALDATFSGDGFTKLAPPGPFDLKKGASKSVSASWTPGASEAYTIRATVSAANAESVTAQRVLTHGPLGPKQVGQGVLRVEQNGALDPLTVHFNASPTGGTGTYSFVWTFDEEVAEVGVKDPDGAVTPLTTTSTTQHTVNVPLAMEQGATVGGDVDLQDGALKTAGTTRVANDGAASFSSVTEAGRRVVTKHAVNLGEVSTGNSVTQTVLQACSIPSGLGTSGGFEFLAAGTADATAAGGDATVRVKLGGMTLGTVVVEDGASRSFSFQGYVFNDGASNAQKAYVTSLGGAEAAAGFQPLAIDTSAAPVFTVEAETSNADDEVTSEMIVIKAMP